MSSTRKEAPSSLFSSLADDIVLNVLARVPRRYHPNISCVSKKLRSLVRSSELHKTRSLLGMDRFYVCFDEYGYPHRINHWFALAENRRLVPIPFPSPPEPYSVALTVGPEIYFVGGYCTRPSSSMWILDSRSGKLRRGPSSLVATRSAAAGLVNDKIYMFGGRCEDEYEEIQAQAFDLKSQTWQLAPNPTRQVQDISMSASLRRNIYARNAEEAVVVYDTRDGEIEIPAPAQQLRSRDFCVVDNVLYIYQTHAGLLWYESKEKEWRVVEGLNLKARIAWSTALAEYNGKLAFLWHERDKSEVWCSVIVLYGSKVAVRGRVEWSGCLLSDLPYKYKFKHCLCLD
ncbi:unnamed protein product [Thlaspi arvense]|uniref:F-box domain-containing protein n=1 Tax=Thlaspi arvense TaxID=13288 RepID=A0AAU9SGA4_THLAR|nr:unnamed protein product [Thlaspi arvense]